MRTHNEFQWELGKWYETTGEGVLCSPGWFHFYSDPLVGMFMNPIHTNIKNPRLFRAEVEGKFLNDNETKYGYSRTRLVEELPVPQISPVQRVRFAIFCVKEVYKEKKWNEWADNWLSGKDRTEESATSAAYTAENKTSAFCAVENTIITFYAARSRESAFYAAKSATKSTEIASSTTKNKKIDLVKIAQKAMEE